MPKTVTMQIIVSLTNESVICRSVSPSHRARAIYLNPCPSFCVITTLTTCLYRGVIWLRLLLSSSAIPFDQTLAFSVEKDLSKKNKIVNLLI